MDEERLGKLVLLGDAALREMLAGNAQRTMSAEAALKVLKLSKSIYEEALARLDGSAGRETPGAGSEPRT